MNKSIKIELSNSEIRSLLAVFFQYNKNWISDRNSRYMIEELLGKLQVKFANAIFGSTGSRIISFTYAQAAAFDEAFRLTAVPADEKYPLYPLYEETVVNKVLAEINRVL